MRAHQFELSTEGLDFYGGRRSISTEGSLSLSEKKVVIVSTEEVHFYGTDALFY